MAAPGECVVEVVVAVLAVLLVQLAVAGAQGYTAQSTLVDCGASGTTTAASTGKVWSGDVGSTLVSKGMAGSAPVNFSALLSNTGQDQLLYSTARFFTEKADYTFTVTPGRYWLRLYFLAFPFGEFDPAKSLFSVYTSRFLLLQNFSVLAVTSDSAPLLFKEYSLNITSTSFTVTFEPEPGSYAFVNAIEVVSLPADAYQDDLLLNGNVLTPFGLERIGLQTVFRLNVGGPRVTSANDSDLSRTWVADEPFLWGAAKGQATMCDPVDIKYPVRVPEYIAPRSVYSTGREIGLSDAAQRINITWLFDVDVGYWYYVRLHFAETKYAVINTRVFNVYLNWNLVTQDMDLVLLNGQYVPYYIDYPVSMLSVTDPTLAVQIGPTPARNSVVFDAILNGIEILKMNNSVASLVGTPVAFVPKDGAPAAQSGGGKKNVVVPVAGAAVGVLAVLLISGGVWFYCCRPSSPKKQDLSQPWVPLVTHHGANSTGSNSKANSMISLKSNGTGTASYISAAPSNLGRYFTFAELAEATNNFDEALLLGVGGFGKVYRAEIDGTKVAVKRGNPRSEQGLTEFQTEIEMLSKLRHRHLVSLVGYCEEHCEMILVYDYMSNGPLRGHLYGTDAPALSWRQRLEILIGSARGLHYLHTGAAQGIIHRDVKTTNILLDDNFVAKVADFGLSKTGPSLDRTHVSTAVKGSFGYLDPEYFRRQQLTEKSDVYSFGVVLMEVLCARPAINPSLPREQVNIAEWAMHWQRLGLLEQIIDPKLKGYINPESLKKYGETAEKCLQEQGIERPAMGDVLWNLEYALQLHETSLENELVMEASGTRSIEMPSGPSSSNGTTNLTDSHSLTSQGDSEDAASAVFSQLVNPQGR